MADNTFTRALLREIDDVDIRRIVDAKDVGVARNRIAEALEQSGMEIVEADRPKLSKYTRRSTNIRPHDKSIVLGGGKTLYPIPEGETEQIAAMIEEAMRQAENAAFRNGYEQAQTYIRRALGIAT